MRANPKKKPSDRCADYCGGILRGIVENIKNREGMDPDFAVEIKPAKGLTWVPPGTFEMKCPLHGRTFLVRQVKP